MATQLQMRSGTTLQNDIFTGAPGEITYDTDKKNLRIHDGETIGGMEIASAGTADFVVDWQAPTAENNYTWYRKYKSGWVEQGGKATETSITLPIVMADTNYTVSMTQTGATSAYSAEPTNLTTTGFTYWQYQSDYNAFWQVSGMAAQGV